MSSTLLELLRSLHEDIELAQHFASEEIQVRMEIKKKKKKKTFSTTSTFSCLCIAINFFG
jgi:hypothetical protein